MKRNSKIKRNSKKVALPLPKKVSKSGENPTLHIFRGKTTLNTISRHKTLYIFPLTTRKSKKIRR